MTTTPTIALTSLSIQNFRGIDSLDLDFRRPDGQPNSLVVLAGPNGCGKTSVLEAALIAAGGSDLVTGRRGKAAIRSGAADYSISAQIDKGMFPWPARANSHESPASNSTLPHWYFSSWRAPELVGPIQVSMGRAGRKPRKNDTNRLKNIKRSLVDAAAFKDFKSRRKVVQSSYEDWITRINEAWRKFYPDDPSEFVVDLVEGSDENDLYAFDLFQLRPGGITLEVEALSAGQLELFLFLAALVLNDEREGIIFIDEPELHLDPQWHRLIVRSLVELQPRAQFIVATHSPEIYDAARSYERHFLVPDDDPRSYLWDEVGRFQGGG